MKGYRKKNSSRSRRHYFHKRGSTGRSKETLQQHLFMILLLATTTTTASSNPPLPLCNVMSFLQNDWHRSSSALAMTTTPTPTTTTSWKKKRIPFCRGKTMTKLVDIVARGGSIPPKVYQPHHHEHDLKRQKNHNLQSVLPRRPLLPSLGMWYNNLRTGTVRRPCTILLQHLLYWVTAADAVHSLFLNEYSGIYRWLYAPTVLVDKTALVPSVYSKLFYFARLRPRLLYAIGALVRA
jgi:hypothetical protein